MQGTCTTSELHTRPHVLCRELTVVDTVCQSPLRVDTGVGHMAEKGPQRTPMLLGGWRVGLWQEKHPGQRFLQIWAQRSAFFERTQ
jgi:hypothetical protein